MINVPKSLCSIMLIAALPLLFQSCNTTQDPQALYSQYYEKPAFTETTAGIRHMEALKSVYNDSDYETASRLLKKVQQNPRLRVYLGICYLELDQTSDAIETFNSLLTDPTSKYKAGWYLALCHLKNGNLANCKTTLSNLVKDKGDPTIHQKANQLLSKL